MAQYAAAGDGSHNVHGHGAAAVPFGYAQPEGVGAAELRDIDSVGKVVSLAHAVAAEILSVLGDQLAFDEYGLGAAAVQRIDKLDIGDIARRDRAEIRKAVFT